MKINVNENLTDIIQYVRECDHIVSWDELIQHCLDYNMYPDLFKNQSIIQRLIDEHDVLIKKGKWNKPE